MHEMEIRIMDKSVTKKPNRTQNGMKWGFDVGMSA